MPGDHVWVLNGYDLCKFRWRKQSGERMKLKFKDKRR